MGGLPQSISVPKLGNNPQQYFFGGHSNPNLPQPLAAALAMGCSTNTDTNTPLASTPTSSNMDGFMMHTSGNKSSGSSHHHHHPQLQHQSSVSSNEVKQRLKNVILQKLNRAGNSIASLPTVSTPLTLSSSSTSAIKSADPLSKHSHGNNPVAHFFPPNHNFTGFGDLKSQNSARSNLPDGLKQHLSHHNHHHHNFQNHHHQHLLNSNVEQQQQATMTSLIMNAAAAVAAASSSSSSSSQQQNNSTASQQQALLNAQLQRALEEEQSLRRTTSEPNLKVSY